LKKKVTFEVEQEARSAATTMAAEIAQMDRFTAPPLSLKGQDGDTVRSMKRINSYLFLLHSFKRSGGTKPLDSRESTINGRKRQEGRWQQTGDDGRQPDEKKHRRGDRTRGSGEWI
jgi:hypothetical protein